MFIGNTNFIEGNMHFNFQNNDENIPVTQKWISNTYLYNNWWNRCIIIVLIYISWYIILDMNESKDYKKSIKEKNGL